jgi:hypothetical protein
MSERYRLAAARIRQELADVQQVIDRCKRAMRAAPLATADQDVYLDSVALNLHAFYSGIERILHHIATFVDGALPEGGQWHQELLRQMRTDVPGLRPPILADDSLDCLREYLAFRHIVRNVYAFKFDPIRLQYLVQRLDGCYALVRTQLLDFAEFLDSATGEAQKSDI